MVDIDNRCAAHYNRPDFFSGPGIVTFDQEAARTWIMKSE
jgi:hypothetical protein